ncbi:MAG: UPF0182 family protein [Gemmatimonadales bacterium]
MLGRRRRLLIVLGVLVALLFAGRFGAMFLTERLWEERVSAAAALVGTRRALLGAALELFGVGLSIGWFFLNFGLAARSIVHEFGDFPRPLGHLAERTVFALVAGIAIVLGLAVGGGTQLWLEPIQVALAGVRFGVSDTLIGVDLGAFAGWLPPLELLERRLAFLAGLAFIGVLGLAAAGGMITLVDRRLTLAPRMRWHVAFLAALVALVIAGHYALLPYQLAATRSSMIGPAEFLLRSTVAQLQLGFAATAAALTLLWGLRIRFVVALGGWVGLALAVLAGGLLVQSRASDDPLGPSELATLRRVDGVAFGIDTTTSYFDTEWRPSLWDRDPLLRAARSDSAGPVSLVTGEVASSRRRHRAWFVLRQLSGGEVSVFAIADDRLGPAGGPVSIRPGDSSFVPGFFPMLTLASDQVRPGAQSFVLGPNVNGVSLSSRVRRVAVAWARQVGEVLSAESEDQIAWRLDPTQRLGAVARFATWVAPRAVLVGEELYWVTDGFLTRSRFPSSRSVRFEGQEVRYARAGFFGVIAARSGQTRVFLRPDADSLAQVWARIASPLVEPASAIPSELLPSLSLPREQLAVQAQVLQGSAWLDRRMARYGRQIYPVEDLAGLGTIEDPLAIPFLDQTGTDVAGLVIGPATLGAYRTTVALADSALEVSAPRELQQRWDRFPFFQQLRDSVRAAGSEYHAGIIRFAMRADTLVAYQPTFALGGAGQTTVVLVNVAMGPRLGAGGPTRTPGATSGEIGPTPVGTDLQSRLDQAKLWLERADDALRRGDLEEFGRAFGFLRELLRSATRPPAPDPER